MTNVSLWERLKIVLQYIVPQHLLSGWMYCLTRCRWRPLKNLMIRYVVHRFQVDMTLAEEPDYRAYSSFNCFFTRELRTGARPIAGGDDQIICPVDGSISQIGLINHTEIFQAKGHRYHLAGLLAGDDKLATVFQDGCFATLYLSPRDYHRVHMPLTGRLQQMRYVPGRLFSVNQATTSIVPGLFARNERVISIFQTQCGLMAVILVGAIFVGSMETVWAGQITPVRERKPRHWDYTAAAQEIKLARGDELGRFNMGSTVILLFERGRIEWLNELKADDSVVMGQAIGKLLATSY